MRWKLLRRRFSSITASRMTVRGRLPWPLRWGVAALALGFSAAIGLWAFEFGKEIAGLDRNAKQELAQLRDEVAKLREERDKAQSIANTAESLLKTERAAQERLASQLRQTETDNLSLKADLGFFERLMPAAGAGEGVQVRGFEVEAQMPGRMRYQLLLMQGGHTPALFTGRVDITLAGTKDNRPWSMPVGGGAKPLQIRQYARLEGEFEYPADVVVKTVQVRVTDNGGSVKATQTTHL